ncbi:MAG: erythronate-4-phosphate dehydrogenase, partial [Paludibacteraceae bacterium]|nr:erythronate-4-phosphate dehydrogenase [Paludibacteraceae bacterium]
HYSIESLEGKTIGIVGVGNVGSRVYKRALDLGMRTLLSDPPLEAAGGSGLSFTSLDEIAHEADIITFHVPLDSSTRHLINSEFLSLCKPDAVIINASRGAVLNTADAIAATQRFVIDCWEGEPDINRELLSKAVLATPHIAGYSIDGKANGTVAALNATSEYFGWGAKFSVDMLGLPPKDFSKSYNIKAESDALKAAPEKFEWFRNNYPVRRDLI